MAVPFRLAISLVSEQGAAAGSALAAEDKREMTLYSRYYLVVIALYVWLWPETIPLMYAVQVGAWWLGILRIPLEHEMREYREHSAPLKVRSPKSCSRSACGCIWRITCTLALPTTTCKHCTRSLNVPTRSIAKAWLPSWPWCWGRGVLHRIDWLNASAACACALGECRSAPPCGHRQNPLRVTEK